MASTPASGVAAHEAVDRATWQPLLFASRLRRLDLLRLDRTWPVTEVRLQVLRNQPFELVERTWAPFLAFAGFEAAAHLGGYDDALTLTDVDPTAAVYIVSIDLDRVAGDRSGEEVARWLDQRVSVLRQRTTAPVVVTDWASEDPRAAEANSWLQKLLGQRAGVQVAAVSELRAELDADFFDDRAVELRATRWSDAAVLAMARAFGTQWLPAVLSPPVKAVVVDLDQTLYAGVLGEDGPGCLQVTPAHADLQRHLITLGERGIFVALSSRNEQADVERLFDERPDFPLGRRHLAVIAADWGHKAQHLEVIAQKLNISSDAMVFLDDNPGELAAVGARLPGVKTLHAADPVASLNALRHCPGLFRFRGSTEDGLRVSDRIAGLARENAYRDAEDPREYLQSLGVILTYRVDDVSDVPRLAELSAKTNQFSTTLRRTPEAELNQRLVAGDVRTVAVDLADRLSDSGTVGSLVARHDGSRLVVEEIAVSCRALGRGVEDALLAQALLLAADEATTTLRLEWVEGPRNGPALAWLRRLCGGEIPQTPIPWSPEALRQIVSDSPFSVRLQGVLRAR